MAGIKEAMRRVMDRKNRGIVVAKGKLTFDDTPIEKRTDRERGLPNVDKTQYIIVKLDHDGGMITQYDNGSDLYIASDVDVKDKVILMINNNWNATWQKVDENEVQQNTGL